MIYNVIKIGVLQGTDLFVLRDRFEFSGPLLNLFEEVHQKLEMYNRTRSEFEGLYRIDMKDYPEDVIYETLLFAFVHRDYSFEAPMIIRIYDDRIEFVVLGSIFHCRSSDLIRGFCLQQHVDCDMYGIAKIRKVL